MSRLRWALVFVIFCGGCASYWKRKDCEKINWHKHGFDVAMSGKRLDADSRIKECEKVEANVNHSDLDTGFKSGMAKYCEIESVHLLGREGQFFNAELCEGDTLEELKAKYQEGINSFCTPTNAFSVGAGGKLYSRVCSAEQEEAFLPEYRRGRRRYLRQVVSEKEKQINDISMSMIQLQRQLSSKHFELMAMPQKDRIVRTRAYDPTLKREVEKVEVREDPIIAQRRQRVQWDIDDLTRKIETETRNKNRLQDEARNLRTELVSLTPSKS